MGYDELFYSSRELFTEDKEKEIFETLVNSWGKTRDSIIIQTTDIQALNEYPFAVGIGVAGIDWAGLADATMGILHQYGWNLYYVKGTVVSVKEYSIAILIAAIKIETPEEKAKFTEKKQELEKKIKDASKGSIAKKILLSIEVERLTIYEEVVNIIQRGARKSEISALLNEEGEAIKFFASRPMAYLRERAPSTIAKLIINNFRIQKMVRDSHGQIQVHIENLKTFKEELTGITIGAYERDYKLKDFLDALNYVVPGFRLMYNKEFSTGDGILLTRLEISTPAGKYYKRDAHRKIKRALENLESAHYFRKSSWIEASGGFEHYLRAIIPFLLKEYMSGNKNQVYINLIASTDMFSDFKIFIVSGRGISTTRLLEGLEKQTGISILTAHPPRVFEKAAVNVIDVRVDRMQYTDLSLFYKTIRNVLEKYIGRFRDFDEGMRKMDIDKLQMVRASIKDIPDNIIKGIYYSIEDFYRMSAPIEELISFIKISIQCLQAVENTKYCEKYETQKKSTLIVVAFSSDKQILKKIMNISKTYEVTLSKYEMEDTTLILLSVKKEGNPLPENEAEKILTSIKK